ncbi:MAG: hypothetical protein ACQESR_05610 [Planctomycetota bacterium]
MNDSSSTIRNRWLIAALSVVVLFYVGDMGYRKFVQEPASENKRLKKQLTEKINAAEVELKKAMQAAEQLPRLEQRSLPWNADMARSRYRDWLLKLAENVEFEGIRVDSGDPVAVTESLGRSRESIQLYRRFTFSLRGRGDLGQITQFLHDFYRGGHLHKVESMSLAPGSETIDLNVSIEAIALPHADREVELTTMVSDELALPTARDYQLIARRNFFAPGGMQSAWRRVALSAVTSDARGAGQAWFRVAGRPDTVMLSVGESFSRASLEVVVVGLDEDNGTATVNVNGQRYTLAVGRTLADATPLRE